MVNFGEGAKTPVSPAATICTESTSYCESPAAV
jgi:hypothetical protein